MDPLLDFLLEDVAAYTNEQIGAAVRIDGPFDPSRGLFHNPGGGASLHQNGRVGRYAFVAGMSAIHRDIIPFGSVYGNPPIQ